MMDVAAGSKYISMYVRPSHRVYLKKNIYIMRRGGKARARFWFNGTLIRQRCDDNNGHCV